MKYLLMCCFDETRWNSLPDSKRDGIMDAYGKLIGELKQSGKLLAGAKLENTTAAVTVRETNGKPLVTHGPFAETTEQLGGYHLVECEDQAEATAIAGRIPTLAAGGVVEVRAVLHTE